MNQETATFSAPDQLLSDPEGPTPTHSDPPCPPPPRCRIVNITNCKKLVLCIDIIFVVCFYILKQKVCNFFI